MTILYGSSCFLIAFLLLKKKDESLAESIIVGGIAGLFLAGGILFIRG